MTGRGNRSSREVNRGLLLAFGIPVWGDGIGGRVVDGRGAVGDGAVCAVAVLRGVDGQ